MSKEKVVWITGASEEVQSFGAGVCGGGCAFDLVCAARRGVGGREAPLWSKRTRRDDLAFGSGEGGGDAKQGGAGVGPLWAGRSVDQQRRDITACVNQDTSLAVDGGLWRSTISGRSL